MDIDLLLHHLFRPQDHVGNGFRRRPAVADDRHAIHAQQRNAAIFLIVEIFEDLSQGIAQERHEKFWKTPGLRIL